MTSGRRGRRFPNYNNKREGKQNVDNFIDALQRFRAGKVKDFYYNIGDLPALPRFEAVVVIIIMRSS